jgi:hypothetical protein
LASPRVFREETGGLGPCRMDEGCSGFLEIERSSGALRIDESDASLDNRPPEPTLLFRLLKPSPPSVPSSGITRYFCAQRHNTSNRHLQQQTLPDVGHCSGLCNRHVQMVPMCLVQLFFLNSNNLVHEHLALVVVLWRTKTRQTTSITPNKVTSV